MACGREGRRRKIIGATRKRAPGASFSNRRKAAKERDGNRCRICGFEHFVHVHHIKPRKLGGEHAIENLITLCPNHHGMAHAKMLPPAELIASLAAPLAFDPIHKPKAVLHLRNSL